MQTPRGTAPRVHKTVGIDLGTTNSVIAVLDATDSALITGEDEQGRKTFPSVVGYHPGEQRAVAGRPALALRGQGPAPVSSVKRSMGLDRRFAVGPDTLTPPEVSARVLRLLRDVLARTLNDPRYLLDAAVVTMPAYFNHNQIEATRQAAELAGYEVAELLHEPTAAAIYYSWALGHGDATYLVYDLGGGTFDVSVVRRRLGDYEVLGVSGDPFLGGDDFDRLLASHLQTEITGRHPRPINFDLETAEGAANFARLVHAAEGVKIDLSERERVERYVPDLLHDAEGGPVSLEAAVERAAFNGLIKDKVDRTIDACHEALRRARDKAGVRLGDIDHVILVGGSTRIPLVRETVRAAFCNPQLAEHARSPEPLLHEPDLCVAYGAALRGATYGTRFVDLPAGLELHLTSPLNTRETAYPLTGAVGGPGAVAVTDGGSVRVRSFATGLTDEAFLDARGTFAHDLELHAEADNLLELAVCDPSGRELAQVSAVVRHRAAGPQLGQAVLPTQLITKPLHIEVLNRRRERVRKVVAPVGATLPAAFACTCRTVDQAGRVVVPIYEENRVVKQMVVADLDPSLPVGSPVDVELDIDVKHNIRVRVLVREAGRCETAYIEAAPPPRRPTRAEIDEVHKQIDEILPDFTGSYRSRVKARVARLSDDLTEALRYEDEPKAIQRMAELREVLQELQARRGQLLEPPWPRFAQLVRSCLDLGARVADATGRAREELFEHVYAQERYAEQAYEEHNQALYRECLDNLGKYAGYLDQVLRDALPRPDRGPGLAPEEEARAALEDFRNYLADIWKRVRGKGRTDLDARLGQVARQGGGLTQRAKTEPGGVVREVRRLWAEVDKVARQLSGEPPPAGPPDAGLLEGAP
jgi:molecular chaperone DnaK